MPPTVHPARDAGPRASDPRTVVRPSQGPVPSRTWQSRVHERARSVRQRPGRRSTLSAAAPARESRFEGGFDVWQLYFGLAVVVIAAIGVRPIGLHGKGLVILVLLVVNSALTLQRAVPESVIGPRLRLALIAIGIVASALIMGFGSDSIAAAFPFILTGHAGFRLPARQAVTVAVLTTIACCISLAVSAHYSTGASWWLGLFTGLPVFVGQSNRGYHQAVVSAKLALAEAERAADAEARAQALAERGRIARDVHDVLAHSLAGINLQLEVADALLDQGRADEARAAMGKAQGLVREGLSEVGRTVQALRDATLPLQETLDRMIATAGTAADEVVVSGTPRTVPTEIGQVIVRTAQEGLTNAHKHAPGAAVRLTITYAESTIGLSIVNGPTAAGARVSGPGSGSGMGLVGMRERVELAGGQAAIGPQPDGGWTIEIELPT